MNVGKLEKIFKALIISSIATYIILLFLPYLDSFYLSQEEIDVLSWNNYGSVFPIPNWFAWIMFGINLLIVCGLYFYVRIARTMYLWLFIILILMNPFMGIQTNTGLEGLFYQLISTLDGAILAVAYLTSINEKFTS